MIKTWSWQTFNRNREHAIKTRERTTAKSDHRCTTFRTATVRTKIPQSFFAMLFFISISARAELSSCYSTRPYVTTSHIITAWEKILKNLRAKCRFVKCHRVRINSLVLIAHSSGKKHADVIFPLMYFISCLLLLRATLEWFCLIWRPALNAHWICTLRRWTIPK